VPAGPGRGGVGDDRSGRLDTNSLSLRDATAADEQFLRELYAELRAPELAAVDWSDAQKRAFCDMQFDFQDRHYREHYPGARFAIITLDGRAVGRWIEQTAAGEIRLMDIAVLAGERRRGIGGALLRALCQRADATRCTIRLYVEHANPIRAYYQRLGFVEREGGAIYAMLRRDPGAPLPLAVSAG